MPSKKNRGESHHLVWKNPTIDLKRKKQKTKSKSNCLIKKKRCWIKEVNVIQCIGTIKKGGANSAFAGIRVFASIFSPIWGENILVGPREKIPWFFLPQIHPTQHPNKFISIPLFFFFFPSSLKSSQPNGPLVYTFWIWYSSRLLVDETRCGVYVKLEIWRNTLKSKDFQLSKTKT